MLLADSAKAKEIDRLTIEKYGVPSLLLMENAGMRVADEAIATGAKRFAVVCGKGNNGGDGSSAARHLFCRGADVTVVMLSGDMPSTSDAKVMLKSAENVGVKVIYGFGDDAKTALKNSEVIIDAIFGIGLNGNPKDVFAEAMQFINSLGKYVVAVDVPSGVNCGSGEVFENAVRCNKTVTFGIGRLGLLLYPAKEYAGEVSAAEISFAPKAVEDAEINVSTLEYQKTEMPKEDCHKNSVGRVLVAAGSLGMSGAACLSSTAALRCGAGVVTLCVPSFLNMAMEEKLTEIMTVGVSDNGTTMSEKAASQIAKLTKKYDSFVLGCGLGCNDDTKKLVNFVVKNSECDVILDADGINCVERETLLMCPKNIVITPHIGEMSRLVGKTAEEIKKDLVGTALDFAVKYNTAVVLKCATTVTAFPDGKAYVSTIGNSGMATAGSGDVLAGIIASCVARGSDFKTDVLNGVWLHSSAGDAAAQRLGKRFMCASDIIESLKYIFKEV